MKRSLFLLALFLLAPPFSNPARAELRAGAAVVDVTPKKLPVLVNGGMLSRSLDKVNTPVNARALALSDGKTTLAIVVVDSCMMPRPLLDEAKALAAQKTGIPADHLLMSATHTHSAPSCMGALGTDPDPEYVPFLREKLVEAVAAALANLKPARVGFAKADAGEYTALRRWIRQPGAVAEDPFGNPTGRANMHSGRIWDDVTGESGPEDPDLSLVSIQTADGKPLAVLANFSMHYFGDKDISADYFGRFCNAMKEKLSPGDPFVGIMSHGCSGDIWRRDYTKPESEWNANLTIDEYVDGLLGIAMKAYDGIDNYRADADLAMAERRMTLQYRVPDKQRLEWAQRIVAEMGDRPPKTQPEVYAREQIILHERQRTEIVVQGLRIGDVGIATTPCETYAVTGLKIKAASPLPHNVVIELANGGDGYIPPPEQHLFGGYNTWAARSAGLETTAEPKIAEACIGLLENVAAAPRRDHRLSRGPAAEALAASKPAAWWRLDEFAGPHAIDSSGNHRDAFYEPRVTFFLEGPRSDYFCADGEKNRAAMFAGGRLRARIGDLGDSYSVSLWAWNGMPPASREISGWIFSRGVDNGLGPYGDHLGVAGTGENAGRLVFFHGTNPLVAGKAEIPRWEWRHIAFVRAGDSVKVYLNGELDLEAKAAAGFPSGFDRFFVGGRSDNDSNWE
ncbi:MAG: LamG domain-containing protein, partial [Verrucomicrobiae bacterium]|nr:LamG domain-containing protein [Verrucomicrobiae bacterium]